MRTLIDSELMDRLWRILEHHHMKLLYSSIECNIKYMRDDTGDTLTVITIMYACFERPVPMLITAAGTSQEDVIMNFEGAVVAAKEKISVRTIKNS